MNNKIIVTTLWDTNNYGNRLQAYALNHILETMGYTPYYLCCQVKSQSIINWIKDSIKLGLYHIGFKRFYYTAQNKARKKAVELESKNFFRTLTIKNYRFPSKMSLSEYKMAITGSDQVWHNWNNDKRELEFFYLRFMPYEKRISYAASFGFDSFPEKDKDQHIQGIQGMKYISCREETGCNLVRQVSDKPVTLVLDPTACVEEDYWLELEKKPHYINGKYLLLFMIGSKDSYYKAVVSYANSHNLEIIDLYDSNRKDVWSTSTGEVLWLIKHAELICTDSFHCTLFGIIFERPLQVFKRQQKLFNNMYGRIETLLSMTDLEKCQYDNESVKLLEVDYSKAKKNLESKREESIQWLANSLMNNI